MKSRSEDQREIGLGMGSGGPNQQLAGKQRVPCQLSDSADFERIGRIGAAVEVLHIQLAAAQIDQHSLVDALEVFFGKRLIDGAPVDVRFGQAIANNELIAW